MRPLTLEGIDLLDAIARSGSFSAAGVRLGKVTSTVSYAVGRLEADLALAVGQGPSGGGLRTRVLAGIEFCFCVAPRHPLAAWPGTVQSEELRRHRTIVVSDSARRLPPRTVGLLPGQQALAVPDMRTKYALQAAGLGVGFLPRLFVQSALERGLLVTREVEEPKPDDQVLLAWRTGQPGKALKWWREALAQPEVVPQFLARASRAWVSEY